MSPELRAKDLLKKFTSISSWVGGEGNISIGNENAKKASLIAVNEIIEAMKQDDIVNEDCHWANSEQCKYWESVHKCIENL